MSNRHVRFAARSAVVAVLLLVAGGGVLADTAIPLPSAARAQLDKYLGAGVVGDPVPAGALLPGDQYLPKTGAVMTYRVLEEGEDPSTETHTVAEETTDPMFTPGWRYARDPVGAIFMQASKDGGIVIPGEQDLKEKVLSHFTPGQPLVIVGLRPGESRRVTTKVEVSDLSDPTDIDHKGSLDITYTYVGAYKVTVPAGSYDAALIRWDYKGSVGPADIEETSYRFIAPGAGMVAMIENRHISAMLIYNDKTKLGKLLQSWR
jgi:hypothetical protein